MMDSSHPDGSMKKLLHGEPVGAIKEWHPGVGFTDIPATAGFSAPNGVIVSPDGKHIFVAYRPDGRWRASPGGQHPPKGRCVSDRNYAR
jgi:sugar lactone lactonase YvrE